MVFLILINNAPGYVTYFKKLGDLLKKDGHEVLYACESRLPEYKHNTSLKNEKTFYFTDYNDKISEERLRLYEEKFNLRSFYFPCFDRNYHLNINHDKDAEMDQHILRLLSFYENIFNNNKIDAVIYENVSNSFAYAAFAVCKVFNIKYLGLISSRIPGRFEIWEDEYGNIEKRKSIFEKVNIEDISEKELSHIQSYINNINKIKPDYMKNNPTRMNISYLKYYSKRLNILVNYLKYYLLEKQDAKNAYQSARPFKTAFHQVKRNLLRKIKIAIVRRMYDSYNCKEDKYFIFPMHYQPESSTSVNAMYYVNQYEVIKNIAFSLPIGYKLYVKEHPNGVGFQSMDFYKNLKNLPNVKYIDPLADNNELISYSQGVITLTSTLGYEALLMNKLVFTIGNVFYNFHPNCFKVSLEEIYKFINKHKCDVDNNVNNINNIKFVYTYFKDTFEGSFMIEKDSILNVKNAIYQSLKVHK